MTATGLTRRSLLVDGNNLLKRSEFAALGKHVDLSNREGIPTAALMIFVNMVSRYVREVQPDNMVVCWDGGRSTFRTALSADYKAERKDKPEIEEETTPFGQAKEFLTLAGIHHCEQPGVEADDLIAAYWRGKQSTDRVYILSGDKDFLQLLDGWTEQIRPGGGVNERWTTNRVRTELGCKPEHLPIVMALTGDATDGVIGVPGFGTKTAVKVLSKHDWSLDALLRCDQHPKLVGQDANVHRNLALVDLRSPQPGIAVPPVPRFTPTSTISVVYPALEQFLTRYQLASVHQRLASGSLWRDEPHG